MVKTEKRILSLLLCILMLATLLPRLQLPTGAVTAEETLVEGDMALTAEETVSLTQVNETVTVSTGGTCGENVSWSLSETGTLTISGTGAMADYAAASNAPWFSQRENIKILEIGEGITTIGDRAFYSCTKLQMVTIGGDVTTIGDYAFRGCTMLKTVTLPENVTTLKDSAFRGCTALKHVRLEGNAPAVGNYVFNDITGTITIEYYEGAAGYDVAPWTGFTHTTMHVGTWNVITPPTCTTAGTRKIWCSYCQETITETYIPDHRYVDGICIVCQHAEVIDSGSCGYNVQWQLDVLGTLTISGSGEMDSYSYDYGPYLHYSCSPWYGYSSQINNIVIQSGVTKIGDIAFCGLHSVTSVTIGDSVTSIGWDAFYCCGIRASVTNITFLGSAPYFDLTCFMGVTAMVYYPCNDATWTFSVKEDHGGTLTWKEKHTLGDNVITRDATCTQDATQTGICRHCGITRTNTIPNTATGHAFGDDVITQDATCTQDAIQAKTCQRCGTTETNTIPNTATGHTFDEDSFCINCRIGPDIIINLTDSYGDGWNGAAIKVYADDELLTTATIPSGSSAQAIIPCTFGRTYTFHWVSGSYNSECSFNITRNGEVLYTCTGAPNSEIFYTIGNTCVHQYETVITPPTCTGSGETSYICNLCGEKKTETVSATGHSYQETVIQPTCTREGSVTNTCTSCGDSYSTTTPATGHTEKPVPGYAATCTTTGLTDGVKCTVCDAVLTAQQTIPATGHSYQTTEELPTCTGYGYQLHECVNCDYSFYTHMTQPTGHRYESVEKAPTCINDGFTTHTCSVCEHTYISDYKIATGHAEKTLPGYAATCTTTGLTDGVKCTVCDAVLTAQQTIPATGHTEKTIPGYAATCTTTGLTDGVKCTVCDAVLTAQKEIPALGHTEETVPGYAATCTTTGLTDGVKCTVCDAVLTAQEKIPALGHTEETVPGYAATCTTTGLTDGVKCTVCDAVLTAQEEIPALGHTEETVPGYAATCTTTGLTDGVKCTVCDAVLTAQEEIPALGHTEKILPGYAATCTENGLTDGAQCTVCNEMVTIQQVIPATGHDNLTTEVAPTCTEYGYNFHQCQVCGYHSYDHVTFPTGHSYQPVVTPPTCTEEGFTTYTCSGCSDAYIVDRTPLTAHHYEDDTCTGCGKEKPPILPGDVNCDGERTIADVARLYAHVTETLPLDAVSMPYADVNGDGTVDIADTARLYAHVKGTNPLE